MKRRNLVVLLGMSPVAGGAAIARAQPRRRARVGFLHPGHPSIVPSRTASLLSGIEATGVRADQVEIVVRAAAGDASRLPALARELVAEKLDVAVTVTAPSVRAIQDADPALPIVAHDLEADPVALGFVQSYPRPGGRLTGVFFDFPEFRNKWIEMIRECMPGLKRVALLWDRSIGRSQLEPMVALAERLQLQTISLEVGDFAEIERAFLAAKRDNVQAVLVLSSPLFGSRPGPLAELGIRHALPTISLFPEVARAGGLIAYGPDIGRTFQLVGALVGKILRGAKPADLPVERPAKFELVVNMKTARALGLGIPSAVLVRADEIVE